MNGITKKTWTNETGFFNEKHDTIKKSSNQRSNDTQYKKQNFAADNLKLFYKYKFLPKSYQRKQRFVRYSDV